MVIVYMYIDNFKATSYNYIIIRRTSALPDTRKDTKFNFVSCILLCAAPLSLSYERQQFEEVAFF